MKILKAIFLMNLSFSILAKEPTLFGDENLKNGEAINYTIDYVRIDKSGWGYVYFTQSLGGTRPSCAALNNVFAFDTEKVGGDEMFSLLLTAQVSGKNVEAHGTGNCDVHPNVESLHKTWIVN